MTPDDEKFEVLLDDHEVNAVIAGLRCMAEILTRETWKTEKVRALSLERAAEYRALAERILNDVVTDVAIPEFMRQVHEGVDKRMGRV